MIIPFFIKYQQENLSKYVAEVAQRKVSAKAPTVSGCAQALTDANHFYYLYLNATKSFVGKIKSFVPFTKASNYRMDCAKQINIAYSLLKQVEDNARQIEANRAAVKPSNQSLNIRRAKSDDSVHSMPKNYASPIPRRKSSDDLTKPFSSKPIPIPNRLVH